MNRSYQLIVPSLIGLWACLIQAQNPILLPLQGDLSQLFMYYTTVSVGTPPIAFTTTVRMSHICKYRVFE